MTQTSSVSSITGRGEAELCALNRSFVVVSYDATGKIIAANNRFMHLIGYDLEDVLQHDATQFISSTASRNRLADVRTRLGAGETVEEVALWIARNGAEIWLKSRFVPIFAPGGGLQMVVQIAEDVTDEQRQTDEHRGQVEGLWNSQLVVHFATDGTILAANDGFLKTIGYDASEIIGLHHAKLVHPGERDSETSRQFWSELVAGEHRSGEFRRIRGDGSSVWLSAVYSPITDLAGRVIKIVKYATDITAEKARQAEYESQVTAISKSNAVITFDMHGTVLDANDLFLEACGYQLDEIVGRHHRIFVDRAHAHSAEYTMFWAHLRKGNHHAGQYRRIAKGGREMWLQATYNPIFDASGTPTKIIKYASLVTDERLLKADHQGQIAAIDNAQCVIAFNLDGTVADANENFLSTMGYRFSEVRGRHHRMFVEPELAASAQYASFWEDLAAGQHKAGEYRRVDRNGREVWLQATYNPIRDMNGRVFKVVKYATDVTAQKLSNADFAGQIDAINKSQATVVFTLDGTILDVNANFLETMGYAREELVGRHHSLLVERAVATSPEYAAFWASLRSGNYSTGLYHRIGKNGKQVWLQASYNPIFDLNGNPWKVVKYATDVTANVALAEAFDEAKRQAHHDAATSLPNRNKLAAFLNDSLVDPAGTLAVFYIDLDRFKGINDNHGHHVGDRVLGEVADRMRRLLRDNQIVARVGGDEFVIAAPGVSLEAVERLCKQLYDAMAAPIRHDSGELIVGLSIGIAMAPHDGGTPDELLRAADAALYRSKQNGRGIYSFYSSDLNERINSERRLVEEMRNSLAAGDFFIEYQPRYCTRSQGMRSVEALVRWAHPERGRISPADFIPLAEQSGLIVPLGEWVLRTACETATGWDGIGVSVNVSPVQFRDPHLVDRVRDALAVSGLAPGLLELEITEGVLLEDADRAVVLLNELKALGIKLAMDDFGTGYSSLSYLRNFPFDVIKIDRSFIKDIDTQKEARSIVQAILGLGKALNLSVTAEGVETSEQLALLAADQCAEIQGFLLSAPTSAARVSAMLSEGNADEPRESRAA